LLSLLRAPLLRAPACPGDRHWLRPVCEGGRQLRVAGYPGRRPGQPLHHLLRSGRQRPAVYLALVRHCQRRQLGL